MVTNILEEFVTSIFCPEDGGSISLQNVCNHIHQTTWCPNPADHSLQDLFTNGTLGIGESCEPERSIL
jgi:hypothetical protein